MKTIHVAVAVIQINDKILIAKRPEHLHKGGYWEFPGGKKELNETIEQALVRECQEELNITPNDFEALTIIEYDYPEKKVNLDVWVIKDYLGVPNGREGQPIVWCAIEKLSDYQFPEANQEIINLLVS